MNQQQDLSLFSAKGVDKGVPIIVNVAWHLVSAIFFQLPIMTPNFIKTFLLRLFGGKVGRRVLIRSRVNILRPWNISIGDNVWIGDGCQLLNLERITIESNSALAHEVYLAAGSHDISSRSFAYLNKPILIKSGCWIATRAFIGPGVTIGINSVVAAGCIVTRDVTANVVVAGNPGRVIKERIINKE